MPSIYVQKNSPYYWIRVYNKFVPDPAKRAQRINSKIELTPIDKKKIDAWKAAGADPKKKPKVYGNDKTKNILEQITQGLVQKDIAQKTGVKVKSQLRLSEGTKEYIASKIKPGDRRSIKKATQDAYMYAANHFIEALGGRDTIINNYLPADCSKFYLWMEEKEYSEASRHNFTNHLHVLWNYFVSQGYCVMNIIDIYPEVIDNKPQDIPLNHFKLILRYYKDQPAKYEWIYYLLLTMSRPSTALVQERSRINFDQKFIEMLNVKETRKKSPYFIYPLFKELENLIKQIIARPIVDRSDRLFSHYKIGRTNYTDAFWWWYADQQKMQTVGLLPKTYQMKQIRKTFPSYAINELGFSKEEIKFLLDHTDESIAENYYLNMRYDVIRNRFEKKRIIEDEPESPYSLEPPLPADVDDEETKMKLARVVSLSRKKFEITPEELQKLLDEKLPITQIAKKYGVSDVAVHKKIKAYGLKKNNSRV